LSDNHLELRRNAYHLASFDIFSLEKYNFSLIDLEKDPQSHSLEK